MQREGRVKWQRFAEGCSEWGSWGEVTGTVTQAKLNGGSRFAEMWTGSRCFGGRVNRVMDWVWEETRDNKEFSRTTEHNPD